MKTKNTVKVINTLRIWRNELKTCHIAGLSGYNKAFIQYVGEKAVGLSPNLTLQVQEFYFEFKTF